MYRNIQQDNTDKLYMGIAMDVAAGSCDRSTKVGCVIVSDNGIVSSGSNHFPHNCASSASDVPYRMSLTEAQVNDRRAEVEARHERPAKYKWTEHAERNAIYAAAKRGAALEGCTIYVPWFPCVECARAIIQSGIERMVAYRPDYDDPRWGEDFVLAFKMLQEAYVSIDYVDPLVAATAIAA